MSGGGKIAITIGCLVGYFLIMIWAAFFTKTGKMKESSIEEFAVGGRNFGFIIVLFTLMGLYITASIYASWFSWATGKVKNRAEYEHPKFLIRRPDLSQPDDT